MNWYPCTESNCGDNYLTINDLHKHLLDTHHILNSDIAELVEIQNKKADLQNEFQNKLQELNKRERELEKQYGIFNVKKLKNKHLDSSMIKISNIYI